MSGVRRLRHPLGRPELPARARGCSGECRRRVGDRLLVAFPYYVDTYGMHSIHGRAPAIATGVAVARPDLSVWVATGDGDALSIGGNHLIHAMRRNVNLKILLFNNKDLRPDQGPVLANLTDRHGDEVDAHRFGRPAVQPGLARALGSEATFVARTMDSDRKHFTEVLRAAAAHRGTALIEILRTARSSTTARMTSSRTGRRRSRGSSGSRPARRSRSARRRRPWRCGAAGRHQPHPRSEAEPALILHHDPAAADPSQAFALSRLDDPALSHIAMGIFRQVSAPRMTTGCGLRSTPPGPLPARSTTPRWEALAGGDTWTVGES